ncbi:hypothetical protein [Novosphingobium mangrovi (ex Hu et al. 2023)]|uniref:Serine-threonine protein kinase n=1 Tax=Novosphingobium mangrovi (ex Hu et al. 2023) TaxID=2930094 RepID=A0ABT0AIF3_9SPHN|nr:hypothetical protein [Novosphingobium mangrovi (ex Hu et al. 2023)]MCJ1962984.1 hypothetical protein [Novosphingobium mangrovi (ex Hu et al. 2023)]
MPTGFEPSRFCWLQFDKTGKMVDGQAMQTFADEIAASAATDVVIISHGWQNDFPVAQALYQTLWSNVLSELEAKGRDPSRIVLGGILWPAKKFDADYDGARMLAAEPRDAGGLLDVGGPVDGGEDIPEDQFIAKLDELSDLLDKADAQQLREAALKVVEHNDAHSAAAFFTVAANVLNVSEEADEELQADAKQILNATSEPQAQALLDAYAAPAMPTLPAGDDGEVLDIGEWIRSVASGTRNAVVWALNKLTYYTMKKRAGVVGAALAEKIATTFGSDIPRVHLVGHSFGARLVTSSANAMGQLGVIPVQSLTLLQGAYSHYGITSGRGVFENVAGHIAGPIIYTHTHNDFACTIAYPIASRFSGDTTLALGDADDVFGAIGANGPQGLDSALLNTLDPAQPEPLAGKVNTVLADSFVRKTSASDAHNNVTNKECGVLVARSMCCAVGNS